MDLQKKHAADGALSGTEKRNLKRRKIMAQLEQCGLDKEANRLMTENSSAALTATHCQQLCEKLLRNVEAQQNLTNLETEEDQKTQLIETRLRALEDKEIKCVGKQLLLRLRNALREVTHGSKDDVAPVSVG
eukprot:symbB.v1.2.029260.t1/scaffold3181.1/size61880/3